MGYLLGRTPRCLFHLLLLHNGGSQTFYRFPSNLKCISNIMFDDSVCYGIGAVQDEITKSSRLRSVAGKSTLDVCRSFLNNDRLQSACHRDSWGYALYGSYVATYLQNFSRLSIVSQRSAILLFPCTSFRKLPDGWGRWAEHWGQCMVRIL